MQAILKELSGGTNYHGIASALEKQAKAKLQTEQMQTIRRASSAGEAIEALMPLAKVTGTRNSNDTMGGYAKDGANTAKYPKDALALAWARARHLGQLDEPVTGGSHSDYAYAGGKSGSVHSALMRMARASGHNDLADAFAQTSERHRLSKDDAGSLRALTGFGGSARTLTSVKKIADRMGIADKTLGELSDMGLGGVFAVRQSYGGYGGSSWDNQNHNSKKFSDVLNENLEIQTRKEAA
jgi:hypothetical protein